MKDSVGKKKNLIPPFIVIEILVAHVCNGGS